MTGFRSRTLTEYIQIIWHRKLLVVLVAAGVLISALLLINRLPSVYESRATVVTSGNSGDRQTVSARVAASTERMISRAFLEPIVQQYDPYDNGGDVGSSVAQMQQDIKVDTTYRSDFPERLTVAYKHTDPTIARAVATDLVSVFGKMNETMEKQAAENASSLASEITEVENRLRDMGKLRAATAARQSAAGRAAGEMSAVRAQRIAAESSIETLTDRQFALEQQLAEQKRQIQEQQALVKLAPSDARASSSYGVLLVRKAELEGQLKEYGAQYTSKNPKVMQAQSQLAEINHQIAQLTAGSGQESAGPVNSAEARELRSMQRELVRIQTELAVTQRELQRKKQGAPNVAIAAAVSFPRAAFPVGEVPQEVQSDYDTLRKRYDVLLNRQDQLERSQRASAGFDPGMFQIVDMPADPQVPIGPNRTKYRWFALALALGVALLVAFALEIPRLYSITDDRDVEYYLGVPVIALIPETVSQADGRSRRLMLGRTLGVLVVAAIISAALLLMKSGPILTQFAALLW